MGSNYQKDLYKQLMEVMAKVDSLESEQKQDRREIKSLTSGVASLRRENASLREKVSSLKLENTSLAEKCRKLEDENTLLRNDNERMKRTLNNDSSNSSNPLQKMRTQNPSIHTMAGSRLQESREPRKDTKDQACQRQLWKKRSAKGSMGTASRRSGHPAGPISQDTVWILM